MQIDYYGYLWAVLPWVFLAAITTAIVWGVLRNFPNATLPVFVLGLAGFLIFLIFSYQAYEWNAIGEEGDYEATRAAGRLAAAKRVAEADHERLTELAWVDGATSTVRVPIKQAMVLQVVAMKDGKVRPANAINPVVAPVPAPAPAPEPPVTSTEGETAPEGTPAASEPTEASEPAPMEATPAS